MNLFRNFLLGGLLSLLFGCSDEHSISDPVNDGNGKLMVGVFLDSRVSGLTYETETQIGKTDVAGEFLFLEGETISFYLGEIYLGSGTAAAEMSPVSIASNPHATLSSLEVKNLASFLQSLDHDRNPSNGIKITNEVAMAAGSKPINFSNMEIHTLGEILAEIIQKTDANLKPVYSENAAIHLNQTFGKVYVPVDHTMANFLPAIETWLELSHDAVHWIHRKGENGRLLTSSLYDKRPFRMVMQNEYTAFNTEGLPTQFLQKHFRKGAVSEEIFYKLTYSPNHHIESITAFAADGSFLSKIVVQNRDGQHNINEVLHYNEAGEFLFREKIIYDKFGLKTDKIYYSGMQGSSKGGEEDQLGTTTYAYTNNGEYRVVTHYSAEDVLTDVYRYRTDKTLRKTEHYRYSDSKWKRIVEYDNLENIISETIISGEGKVQENSAHKVTNFAGDPIFR